MQRDDGSTQVLEAQPEGFVPAPRHQGRYASQSIPRRPNAERAPSGKPALARAIPGLPPLGPATGTSEGDIRARLEMLLGVDESTGRIYDALNELGALDNTVFIFTSDHGYFYGEHGLNEERRLAYEETIRIPLIVRFPRVAAAGSTPDRMALSIDLAPTLLELAGLTPGPAIQGRSLVPVLTDHASDWRTSFLIEYFSDTVFPRIRTMGYSAVRTTRHKYIRYRELDGMDELYDLEADPYERTNLIAAPAGRELLPQMQAELQRLLVETGFREPASTAPAR